ncbi:sushi, von Willebrand factor type A, EGF and pentraxin domain-containing protein 1-like [Diadema antillarum]|uniref:sushi, von Willebrand factor type A, EGF and pentraxin domain-containing protein 1-like n=1 Tax=Diadema antillarum TaxID=105358 RepID=UPI003A8A0C53
MKRVVSVFMLCYVCQLLKSSCGQGSTPMDNFKRQIDATFSSNSEIDVVFLLDASGSMRPEYYSRAVEFFRLTSTHFSSSNNATRISVISYSHCNNMETYIDYISPSSGRNKCNLARNLDRVADTPGTTCTGGALLTARTVLRAGRPNAQGVIILLSDGVSTVGDRPGPIARTIRGEGVVIFSIGVGTIVSYFELFSIATSVDYVFWLNDFGDMSSYGSALGQDVNNDVLYETMARAQCYQNGSSTQCRGVGNCCGQNAACSCATESGSIACTCEPGYTGDGFDCNVSTASTDSMDCECDPGYVENTGINGSSCQLVECPAFNITVIDTSIMMIPPDCQNTFGSVCSFQCKQGYRIVGGDTSSRCLVTGKWSATPPTCQIVECSAFDIVANDTSIMMIPPDCQNTFDSVCTFQCKQGYRIVGGDTSSRCLETGKWSATPPTCDKITCSVLPKSENGESDCDTNDNSIGTLCTLRCDEGYQLETSGVNTTTCRETVPSATAEWDDPLGACQKIFCQGLTVTSPMTIRPVVCQSSPKYGQVCSYGCQTGYTLNGTGEAFINTTCLADGTWSSIPPMSCEDNLPPEVRCPSSINDTTDDLMPTREVNWTVPMPTDNSGIRPDLVGSHNPPHHFHIGLTVVTYVATDMAGLTAQCNFTVEITDEEKPRVLTCPDDITKNTALPTVNVTWNDPVFEDNSGNMIITPPEDVSGSAFPIGDHEIIYTAIDPSQNEETCEFTVSVRDYSCQPFPPPLNGAIACTQQLGGQICKMFCSRKYRFVELPEQYYNCSQGSWLAGSTGVPAQMPWPDCSRVRVIADGDSGERRSGLGLSCWDSLFGHA